MKHLSKYFSLFFDNDDKPTTVSQICQICAKDIMKGERRVKAQSGCSRIGNGAAPNHIYAHLRCFLWSMQLASVTIGYPLKLSLLAKKKLKADKKVARKLSIIQQLKT